MYVTKRPAVKNTVEMFADKFFMFAKVKLHMNTQLAQCNSTHCVAQIQMHYCFYKIATCTQ